MSDSQYEQFQHYGTNAQRLAFTPSPAALPTTYHPLYQWYETDTGDTYLYDTTWHLLFSPGGAGTRAIVCAIDNAGTQITTGIKCDIYVPYACTITAATLLADQAGDIEIDIWKAAFGSYPPVIGGSIVDITPPKIVSPAASSQDTSLTSWIVAISAGDTLRFNVNTCTTITRVQLTLTVVL